ncbi:uncharacterized protein LOC114364084 isoform X1 [Ostrinia furnacalis]|uniref:uncharacterized protein LOC114364084 isoform X1 n=1 Tax=Ostrinia furnacalis TaxID=93504 RepID=UPI00103E053F|nr:uncharacterized protein LOC114364084 isoform X1 [Ostrinia furnacalis]
MDTQIDLKHKSASGKPKSKNTEAEVFVLPPNLLEKLGIQLDKLQSIENSTESNVEIGVAGNKSGGIIESLDKTCNLNTDSTCKEHQSSILETASLMKECVFLSPTFVPTIANTIAGEVEIAKGSNDNGPGNIESSSVPLSLETSSIDELESVNTVQNNLTNNIQVAMCNNSEYSKIPIVGEYMATDNTYLSHNVNTESEDIIVMPKENTQNMKKKINIVQVEVIKPGKGSTVLKFDDNNVLTSVTVDTLIPISKEISSYQLDACGNNQENKIGNICMEFENYESNHNYVKNKDNTDFIQFSSIPTCSYQDNGCEATILQKKENNEIECKINSFDIPTSTKFAAEKIECPERKPNDGLDTEIISNTTKNSQDNNSQDCSVLEKLNLSPKVVDNHQDTKIINKDEYSFSIEKNNVNKPCISKENLYSVNRNNFGCNKDTFNSKSNIVTCNNIQEIINDSEKSKLCTQGVEKPGGQNEQDLQHFQLNLDKDIINTPKADYGNENQAAIKEPEENQSHETTQETTHTVKSLKTYIRKNNIVKHILQVDCANRTNLSKNISETLDSQINDVAVDAVCKSEVYCLCSDFGQLTHYDEDSFYEHIHFWRHKNVACDHDEIFSLYDDSEIANTSGDNEMPVENMNDIPEERSHAICWNEIYDNDKVFDKSKMDDENQNSSDVEMVEANDNCHNNNYVEKIIESMKSDWSSSNSSFTHQSLGVNEETIKEAHEIEGANKPEDVKDKDENIKTRKKRRRSMRVHKDEDSFMDNNEPSSKKEVKCGVCEQVLAKREWEEHSSEEHGFIAWKAGDSFDIQDKKILMKIKQKLNDDGILHCGFCKFVFNNCDNFIAHTKKCMKNKVPHSSHSTSNTLNLETITVGPRSNKMPNDLVKCGVCQHDVKGSDWLAHICQQHNYIAWKSGKTPLKVDNKDKIIKHLRKIIVKHGALVCHKCKGSRHYGINSIKKYLKHIKLCNEVKGKLPIEEKTVMCSDSSMNVDETIDAETTLSAPVTEDEASNTLVKCGASPKEVEMNTKRTSTALVRRKSTRGGVQKNDQMVVEEKSTKIKDSSKKRSVDAEININSPITETAGDTRKRSNVGTENATSPSKIELMKCGDSSKKVYTNIRRTSSPLVRRKSTRSCDTSKKQDAKEHALVVQEKAVKISDSPINTDPDSKAGSSYPVRGTAGDSGKKLNINTDITRKDTLLKSSDSHDKVNTINTSTPLARRKSLRCSDTAENDDHTRVVKEKHSESSNNENKNEKVDNCKFNTNTAHSSTPLVKETQNKDIKNKRSAISPENMDIDKSLTPKTKENTGKCSDATNKVSLGTENNLTALTNVKCGICQQEMEEDLWIDHIQKAHEYLAWKEGENPLDLEDKDQIWQHLHLISKKVGGLVCAKCGLSRKYVKAYLSHIKRCDGVENSSEANSFNKIDIDVTIPFVKDENMNSNDSYQKVDKDTTVTDEIKNVIVKCGVCKQEVEDILWISHIQTAHNYLAWKEEESHVNFEDETQLWQHLHLISKKIGGLVCSKCGLNRKYVKAYLNHINQCDGTVDMNTSIEADSSMNVNTEHIVESSDSAKRVAEDMVTTSTSETEESIVKCGVCKQDVENKSWYNHMQTEHNYLAWKEGDDAVDLEDKDQIWQHLNLLSKKIGGLVCAKCGFHRKYVKAYLSHINQCEKTDTSMNVTMDDPSLDVANASSAQGINVKCGVCQHEMEDNLWNDHMQKAHNYLAWKEGENTLDVENKEQVWQHLNIVSKQLDGLVCSKCGLLRKYVKAYFAHINRCDGTAPNNDSLNSSSMDTSCVSEVNTSFSKNVTMGGKVKCGVCSITCDNMKWIKHIQTKHNYLAWKKGEAMLDLQDPEEIENHLRNIIKDHGSLYCHICGTDRKYSAKAITEYLKHIETCSKDMSSEIDEKKPIRSVLPSKNDEFKCGVCEEIVKANDWIKHIHKHNYFAWKHGETPLEFEDTENVKLHYLKLSRQVEGFVCCNCGFRKKYPKLFIDHIAACSETTGGPVLTPVSTVEGVVECARCSEKMDPKKWRRHCMDEHYNLAWKVGDFPINLKLPYTVEKYLKEYQQAKGSLVCKICGISRASPVGFYAHIIACGKSEEELEEFQNVCEICNNKYLCIYKSQHMTSHREQEYAKERKIRKLEKIKEENERNSTTDLDMTGDDEYPTGRRKAAVKARDVIGQLKADDDNNTCAQCGFAASTAKKLARHKCTDIFEGGSASEESNDSDIDAEVSEHDDDDECTKRKRHKEALVPAKVPNLPFKYNKVNSFRDQIAEDFFKIHYTDEILFPEWRNCNYEYLDDSRVSDYLPKMESSCQIKLNDKWDTFTRFQVKQFSNGGLSIFVGGTVRCLSWIPARVGEDNQRNYLAVSCHMDSDAPRLNFDELSTHTGVIQIWDFGTTAKEIPKLVVGLAHDHGTVWAMDWCPSGARDSDESADNADISRIGLLAVACSNGLVYIYSVPNPSSKTEPDKMLCTLKPVAELRIAMGQERKRYQATAINWSKQKDHGIIMVGYSDGTTALYDLKTTSPLLKATENDVTIFYPYLDRRDHNVCITAVDIYPSADASRGSHVGGACSASMAAVSARLRPPAARLESRHPATAAAFLPGWPAVLFAAEDTIASQAVNELDWYGCARRVGAVRALAGCARCGRVLLFAPPLLRFVDALPPYTDVRKQTVAIIKASPLGKKRKRGNDELAMLVEPLTYEDVVQQYGVEVKLLHTHERSASMANMRESFTERFPLADVTAIAFCADEARHRVAAVGLHAGFILILSV